MPDVALTATRIAPINADRCEIFNGHAGVAITAGQCVTFDATGHLILADADAAAPANSFRGVALNAAGIGQPVAVLVRGWVMGYTIAGVYTPNQLLYLSDTAGAIADAASLVTPLTIGTVVSITDGTFVAYIDGIKG